MQFFQKGFTFPELIVVIGIITTIFAFSVANLSNTQQRTYLSSNITTLISDIKQQQLKAMNGDTDGSGTISDYGIYFETNKYTIFRGTTYCASDVRNYTISLESNIQFKDVTFPSSQLVFQKGSGEVNGYTTNTDTFTIWNTITQEEKVITINRYGAIVNIN